MCPYDPPRAGAIGRSLASATSRRDSLRQGAGAGMLSGRVPFYKMTEVINCSAELVPGR